MSIACKTTISSMKDGSPEIVGWNPSIDKHLYLLFSRYTIALFTSGSYSIVSQKWNSYNRFEFDLLEDTTISWLQWSKMFAGCLSMIVPIQETTKKPKQCKTKNKTAQFEQNIPSKPVIVVTAIPYPSWTTSSSSSFFSFSTRIKLKMAHRIDSARGL